MKKAGIISVAALFLLSAVGCASSGKAIIGQKDPIALVSVVSNREINWKDEAPTDSNTFLIYGNRTRQEDPDMTLTSYADEFINTAETLFRKAIDSTNLISLADKETVLSSSAYREAKTNDPARNTLVKPAEYRFINYRDKEFPAAMVNATGIQRVMFVEFDFTKSMYSGFGKNGECRAEVDMIIRIMDSRGKTLYNNKFSSLSRSTIRVSWAVYSHTGLLELFESAINYACRDFLDSL